MIVDAFADVTGIFSSMVAQIDGRGQVLFGSTRSGVPQIYLGDLDDPSGEPRALTSGTERAVWASFTADERHVVFLRDSGGDENWHIIRVGLDGAAAQDLTPGPPMRRDEPLLPPGAPEQMLYTAHVPTSPSSRLFAQPLAGGAPRLIYEDPSPAFAVSATAGGDRVLLIRWNSASDLVVLAIETASGARTRLFPPDGVKATVSAALYSPDGRTVYVATDEGSEEFAVLALDPDTGRVRTRWALRSPVGATITDLRVAPRADRLAVAVHAGHHTELEILDAPRLTPRAHVDAPLGQMGLGPFTSDGSGLTYWLSTPEHPAEVYRADATTGRSTPLRRDARPGLDTLPPMTVSIAQVRAHDGRTIPVNLYLPRGDPGERYPTIVSFHGGPSASAAIRWNPTLRFLVAEGFAVVEPNIRGSSGFGREYEMADNREKRADALLDIDSVNRWVKAQPWCDPQRVVAYGASYGGYLVLMALARWPTAWRAGVELYGIADLAAFLATTDQAIRAGFVDEFGDLERDRGLLAEFSPRRSLAAVRAPVFVYAGENDPRVPRAESDRVVASLRARGVVVEYMVAAGEGHSLDRRATKLEFLTRLRRFLAEHLR